MVTAMPSGSRRAGELRSVRRLARIAIGLALIAGMFALAYFHASAAAIEARSASVRAQSALVQAQHAAAQARRAARRAQDTANCVNAILGARGPLNDADHLNERQKIIDQIVAEKDKARGLTELATAKDRAVARAGFEVYRRGVAEFVKSLDDWKARDQVIAEKKAAHPVGKC